MQAFVTHFIKLYNAIFDFMNKERLMNLTAKDILERMKKHQTLLYLNFLRFILSIINNLNSEFRIRGAKNSLPSQSHENTIRTHWFILLGANINNGCCSLVMEIVDRGKFLLHSL